ncbi:MAG: helix-turn-helix transcriptional regulator [Prosthecobacter sp.]|nr:helix-turn-helix transcriptional regulator [Prosthecobacter sp.]MBE2285283.1 helix-turn-helix transcriptional regulator [Prosthecobacter sp.]MBN8421404.1 helix-turn-helix transcriptional regulator [Verrucomicrobiota bacterium]
MSRTAKNLIGPQLAKHRTHLAMSQSEFAGLCQRSGWDVSRETLAKIESGIRCVTDLELVEISSALKLPLPVLFPPDEQHRFGRKVTQ